MENGFPVSLTGINRGPTIPHRLNCFVSLISVLMQVGILLDLG